MEDNNLAKRKRGHKGNNGLVGKPSNNKGKQRPTKIPRRSVIDMEIIKTQKPESDGKEEADENSDVEENLDHIPVTAHMYRSAFIKTWCSKLQTHIVLEDPIIQLMLEHTTETACIINIGESPTCHTVEHWRQNVKVKGKKYTVPEVKRPGDRTVRDYHFWMYNSGNFTRQQLAIMVSPKNIKQEKNDNSGGSHICGGTCLNHAKPESNNINQARKTHHKKLREALDKGRIDLYIKVREEDCQHSPKCFLNPGRLGLTEALKESNQDMYNAFRNKFL